MGIFKFKQFSVDDGRSAMKIGTDAVLLGAWTCIDGMSAIVDAGCGSGVISLMLAQRSHNDTKIIAVDVNHEACLDATDNIAISPWKNRVEVIEADITDFFPECSHPMLIISNPPFFNEKLQSPDLSRALARHGVDFGIEELINLAASHFISVDDTLAFIAPSSRDDEIEFMLSLKRLSPRRRCRVFSRKGKKPIRTLWQVGLEGQGCGPTICEDLFICDENNNLTSQYISLTNDFYLDK